MMAARAAQQDGSLDEDPDVIVESKMHSEDEKREQLQKILQMAASNGDAEADAAAASLILFLLLMVVAVVTALML